MRPFTALYQKLFLIFILILFLWNAFFAFFWQRETQPVTQPDNIPTILIPEGNGYLVCFSNRNLFLLNKTIPPNSEFDSCHISFERWKNVSESNSKRNIPIERFYLLLESLVSTHYWIYFNNQADINLFEETMDIFLTRRKIIDAELWYDESWVSSSKRQAIINRTIPHESSLLYESQQPFQRIYLFRSLDRAFNDPDIAHLYKRMNNLQFPHGLPNYSDNLSTLSQSCDGHHKSNSLQKHSLQEHPLVIHRMVATGLGSVMHLTAWPFFYSIGWNRTVLFDSNQFQYKACPAGDLTCYFLPTSSCALPSCSPNGHWTTCHKVSTAHTPNQDTIVEFKLHPTVFTHSRRNHIQDPQFQNKSHLWAMSFLSGYVQKPNKHLRNHLYEARKYLYQTEFLDFPDPSVQNNIADRNCISIHVRHGDKGEEVKLLNFTSYIEKAREIQTMYGASKIFIITDNPHILEQTSNFTNEFTFKWLDNIQRHNSAVSKQLQEKKLDSKTEGFGMLSETLTAANVCRFFIGTGSSNIGRFIAEEMTRKRGVEALNTTWHSLDWEWVID